MLVVSILLKPALDAYRVASGNTTATGAMVEPLKELVISKAFMAVFHSIPGATIQLVGLIGNTSWGVQRGPLVSIGCACVATAFSDCSVSHFSRRSTCDGLRLTCAVTYSSTCSTRQAAGTFWCGGLAVESRSLSSFVSFRNYFWTFLGAFYSDTP